jgi:hypothetical protein
LPQFDTVTSKTAIVGIVLVWLASLIWCVEYWTNGWPGPFVPLFAILGVALVLWAAYRIEDLSPIEIAATALIPPLILLALRGFRI